MSIIEFEGGEPILAFEGEFAFLSNFHPSVVAYKGFVFPTVEHAYQAAKNPSTENLRTFAVEIQTPGQAKKSGRLETVREDWEQVKVGVMHQLLQEKFKIPELREKLLATGNRWLEEGNWWGDRFWGVSPVGSGQGRNKLGELLMMVRASLR